MYADSNRIHSDETSKFPINSARGYSFIMIECTHDTNTIVCRHVTYKESYRTTVKM